MTDREERAAPEGGKADDAAAPEVLQTLKLGGQDADDRPVNDGIGARPRLTWNPVSDSGGDAPPRRADDSGGFAFNLGNALAKLGLDPDVPVAERATSSTQPSLDVFPTMERRDPVGDMPAPNRADALAGLPLRERAPDATGSTTSPGPPAEPLERRQPTRSVHAPTIADDSLPRRAGSGLADVPAVEWPAAATAPVEPPVELPYRAASPAVEAPPATPVSPSDPVTRSYVSPRRSVFDDVVSPSPQLPPTVVSPPAHPVSRAAAPAIVPSGGQTVLPAAPAPAEATPAPTLAPVLPGAGGPILPTLPAAPPVASPVLAPPVDNSPSQSDIRALRSAQLRATRQHRTGQVVARTFLILLLIGGLLGAALLFGRDILFPTSWDPALTPIVDEIEVARGDAFEHTVGLVQQSEADFANTVLRLTIGDQWTDRLPEWRALGLATGDPTPDTVAGAARSGRRAIYDPAADRIYMPDSATADDASIDLRLALEQAYDAQLGATTVVEPVAASLAGVSSPSVIARRAVDQFLVEGESASVVGWQPTDGVPAPIEYELLATEVLGAPLIDATGIDPATATFGTDLSTALATILDDSARPTEAAALQVGERSLAEPVALGNDDWSLVWGMLLPSETVEQMLTLVRADSYRPIDRNGVTCVVGVFEAATAPEADVALANITNWVLAAPLESQATAMRLSETSVQLVTCDPGATAAPATNPQAIVALVERQLNRLAAR